MDGISLAATIAGGVFAAIIIIAAIRQTSDQEVVNKVEIARVVENSLPQRASVAVLGLLLLLLSALCLIKYFVARTSEEQIIALLLWIGNIMFWGVFLISNLISIGRTSVINRDATPVDHERRA